MTTVLVTRPAGAEDPLVHDLRSRGYQVEAVPTVLTRPVDVTWPDLHEFDWVVLTSSAGVATLPAIFGGPRWAAVGEVTARALESRGISVDLIPTEANGPAIAAELPDPNGKRVLLVRASLADPDLPDALRARGATVDEITAYETVEGPATSAEALRTAMTRQDLGAVVFASGSAVRGYVRLGGRTDVPAITIGPRTSAEARKAGLTVVAEATGRSAAELAGAVEIAIPIEVRKDA